MRFEAVMGVHIKIVVLLNVTARTTHRGVRIQKT